MLTQLARHRASGLQDLVDLLGECHERIRRFVALARQAGSRHDVPADQIAQACIDVERYFTQALPLHVADEEESIDPRLRGLSPAVDQALDAVAQQHRQHEPELKALLRATSVLRSNPNDGAARGDVASTALALETQFDEHLRLEERVIFPAIREFLSHETQASIIDELRKRRHSSPVTIGVDRANNPRGRVMNNPAPPDHGVTFDLAAVARELRAEEPYLREGQTARTLIRTPDLRIVVVALKTGKTISEHHASVTASVQTLSGHIRLQLPERTVDVPEGQLLVMGAGLAHDVHAETDSTFLLTLGWPASK